jgi:hypothetical protein
MRRHVVSRHRAVLAVAVAGLIGLSAGPVARGHDHVQQYQVVQGYVVQPTAAAAPVAATPVVYQIVAQAPGYAPQAPPYSPQAPQGSPQGYSKPAPQAPQAYGQPSYQYQYPTQGAPQTIQIQLVAAPAATYQAPAATYHVIQVPAAPVQAAPVQVIAAPAVTTATVATPVNVLVPKHHFFKRW